MAEHFVPDKVEVNLQSQELHFEQDVNRLVHPFRMIISGPSMSGKFQIFISLFIISILMVTFKYVCKSYIMIAENKYLLNYLAFRQISFHVFACQASK